MAKRSIKHVMSVVGARPNFMKAAPVIAALARRTTPVKHTLVHTGQHYDDAMSRIFIEQLGVQQPDHMLEVGSGTHARQTARVMERIEPILERERPDLLLVPGDVNSTLAAALVATKLGIAVGHIEAGLRSFDRSMPEEINRILTDQLSSLLFIHSPEARDNLVREGCLDERIHFVGNTMIDTLVAMRPRLDQIDAAAEFGLPQGDYLVMTLHRPALVDTSRLAEAVAAIDSVAIEMPVVFPIHPRTAAAMRRQGLTFSRPGVRVLQPLGYLEFLSLVQRGAGVITDSGGIQEETTYLGIPCFTLRDNTERPVTCRAGTNVLLGLAPKRILEVPALIQGVREHHHEPLAGWDGAAGERLVDALYAGHGIHG
ncbi:MAG: UDP-N-acetylglucosamine 2-epimerase (non-hydrolyzing) [Actinomycetota bacterium]|nr:UDP-N-acetylglucosamine 2-epimerase (non-hydrolyzing) [Actinomycetota bacterium]